MDISSSLFGGIKCLPLSKSGFRKDIYSSEDYTRVEVKQGNVKVWVTTRQRWALAVTLKFFIMKT